MAANNEFFQKKFKGLKQAFVLFSMATKHPLVVCDEETFDDQILMFTDEEKAKEKLKYFTEEKKYAVSIVKIENEGIMGLISSLPLIGVNSVVLSDGEEIRVMVDQLVEMPDIEALRNDKVPKANPELMLSAIYYFQFLRRNVERTPQDNQKLRELEEEMVVNLVRSKFILAGEVVKKEEDKEEVRIHFLKTKDNREFLPYHVTVTDFKAFTMKNKSVQKYRLIPVPFTELMKNVPEKALGVVINPIGFNLILTRAQIERIIKDFVK